MIGGLFLFVGLLSCYSVLGQDCAISCYGDCVATSDLCDAPVCPSATAPFYCQASTGCVASFDECRLLAACTVTERACWDGTCVSSLDTCAPVPACPESHNRRCNSECTSNSSCTATTCSGTLCADGTCALDSVCAPYNGCPQDKAILCPSGLCASTGFGCSCSTGVACWDGSCVATENLCEKAPGSIKPYDLTAEVISTVATLFTVRAKSTDALLVRIEVPANSISEDTGIVVREVADSILREARLESWPTEQISYHGVFSAAVDLSFKPDTTPTFTAPITLTFVVEIPSALGVTADDTCLAYIDASGDWICEDTELVPRIVGNQVQLSGKTDHFSVFAIIRNDRPDAGSSSSKEGSPIVVIVVIIVIVVLVLLIGAAAAWFFLVKKNAKQVDQEEQVRKDWSDVSTSESD